MTHGHKQSCGDCLKEWRGAGWGAKGGNLDNSNNIVKKYNLKKKMYN